jgi:iron(III) transport system permease protein
MALSQALGERLRGAVPTALALALVALLLAPVATVLARVGAPAGGLWRHLAATVLPDYLRGTVGLLAGVLAASALLGVGTAWLVSRREFPGRALWQWALLLPFAIPAYLSAYAYTDFLQFAGPLQSGLRSAFGPGFRLPEVRSLGGATLVLGLAFYPYVYLAARSAFLEQPASLGEAARLLGAGPWASFWRVTLPLARPAIVVGLSLVGMETLAEFGAVSYFAVDTFATGLYRTFLLPDPNALTAASQLAACLLVPVVALAAIESAARRRARAQAGPRRSAPAPRRPLGPLAGAVATLACALPVLLGFALPVGVFAARLAGGGDARATELFGTLARSSFVLAASASLLAVGLALGLAYLRRLAPNRLVRVSTRLAGLGYALPGGVIAIGLLVCSTGFDAVAATLGLGLVATGSTWVLVYAYQTRFFAVALGLAQSGFERIPRPLDGAARLLGAGPWGVLGRVHLPLLRGPIAAGALLVFVDVLKELPATLVLRPFGLETLAVRVYQLASDERLGEASSGALALILLGLGPVIWLASRLDRPSGSLEAP